MPEFLHLNIRRDSQLPAQQKSLKFGSGQEELAWVRPRLQVAPRDSARPSSFWELPRALRTGAPWVEGLGGLVDSTGQGG